MKRLEDDEGFLKAEARYMDLKEAAEGLTALVTALEKVDLCLLKAGSNLDLPGLHSSKINFGWESNLFREIVSKIQEALIEIEDEIIRYLVKENFAKGSVFHLVEIQRGDNETIQATLVHEPDFKPEYKTHGIQCIEGHSFILQTRASHGLAMA